MLIIPVWFKRLFLISLGGFFLSLLFGLTVVTGLDALAWIIGTLMVGGVLLGVFAGLYVILCIHESFKER